MKRKSGLVLLCLMVVFTFSGCGMILNGNVNISASSEPTVAIKLLLQNDGNVSMDDTDLAYMQAALSGYNISLDEVDENIDGQDYLGVNIMGNISDIERASADANNDISDLIRQLMSVNGNYLLLNVNEDTMANVPDIVINALPSEFSSVLGTLTLSDLSIEFDVDGTLVESSNVTTHGNNVTVNMNSAYPIYAKWQVSSDFVSNNAQYFGDGVSPSATTMPSATPTVNIDNFTDVSGNWAYDDIKWAVENGLMNGISATTFAPDMTLTRGMLVTILGRYDGADITSFKTINTFGDVKTSDYYHDYVEWAYDYNIVEGTGNGNFSPDSNISRQDLATIIDRYLEGKITVNTSLTNLFADDGQIASYAKTAVYNLRNLGIIDGMGNNQFQPKGTATRAQVAKIFRAVDGVINR